MPVYIELNTKEICDFLEDLGYSIPETDYGGLYVDPEKVLSMTSEFAKTISGIQYCSINEKELFKSIIRRWKQV